MVERRAKQRTVVRRGRVLLCLAIAPALGGALTTSPAHLQGVSSRQARGDVSLSLKLLLLHANYRTSAVSYYIAVAVSLFTIGFMYLVTFCC